MTSNSLVLDPAIRARRTWRAVIVGLFAVVCALACPSAAHASLMSPELEDTVASYLAIFITLLRPGLRHRPVLAGAHPPGADRAQTAPSAVRSHPDPVPVVARFGGLLWPLAWMWAYTKPVGYKLAYGTDKHPDYYKEHGLPEPDSATADIRQRVTALQERGVPTSEIDAIRADLAAIESRLAANCHGVRGSNGSHTSRHLFVFRLADFHQVQAGCRGRRHGRSGS